MKRDPEAPRNGYTMQIYVETFEKGLLPHYRL
jgi:hypothetical protein